ncbi:hypothetical protein CRE_02860 [Caenorhabditis remanei]|uniref:Uncharacterized protein n=1 Tax=Caenorhabditis remanei TaxID=31234 RepID=E3LWA1_CAERE|nr:hypothetical protein CRE_02860 [Caenorhabditis remanei]
MANYRTGMTVEETLRAAENARESISRLSEVEQDVRAYLLNKRDYILSEKEKHFKDRFKHFYAFKEKFETRYKNLISDARKCESGFVTAEIKEKKDELLKIASTLTGKAEELAFYLKTVLSIIPDLEMISILLKLTTHIKAIQDIANKLLQCINGEYDHSHFQTFVRDWSEISGQVHMSLALASVKLPLIMLEPQQLTRIKNLLTRIRAKHTPGWYFELADAVGGGVLDEMRSYQERLVVYVEELNAIGEKIGDIAYH